MRQTLLRSARAPGLVLGTFPGTGLDGRSELDQPFGGIGSAVEQHVLDALAQLGRYLLVHAQLSGVHDAHRQPGADGVIEKRGVHRLAHRVVAAERE
jgi:hypothetical protein